MSKLVFIRRPSLGDRVVFAVGVRALVRDDPNVRCGAVIRLLSGEAGGGRVVDRERSGASEAS
jgi:hypothetical protein